jgi:hypothetical protein
MANTPIDGACLCGAVAFHITLPTASCIHCHCSMCRRNHGAGYVTWVQVPLPQLTLDTGEDQLVEFASSSHGSRSFCGRCGTTVLAKVNELPDEASIPLAIMQGQIDREPEAHVFFDDRVAWAMIDDSLPRLGGETGIEPFDDAAGQLLKSWQP